jgi:hypothetical protein
MQASEEMRQQLLEETERVEEKLEQLMRSNREKEEKEATIMHELNTLRLLPLLSPQLCVSMAPCFEKLSSSVVEP